MKLIDASVVWEGNSLVKGMNCWTTDKANLFIAMLFLENQPHFADNGPMLKKKRFLGFEYRLFFFFWTCHPVKAREHLLF